MKLSKADRVARIKNRKSQGRPTGWSIMVNSHNVEFGYELLTALPYAYWLHKNGKLIGTRSAVDTEPFYWFSPAHTINPEPRGWHNMLKAAAIPNIKIHQPDLDWSKWSPPPLKEHYKNDRFVFDKPIICICNRVNVEWGRGVINYFDITTLTKLFKSLKKKYQIIYFNIEGRTEFYDGVAPMSIGDFDLARKHGAIVIHDLHRDNPDLSFNTLQLMVMANSEAFITMNGGYSILASYMGGTNIIYSVECREIKPEVNSFYGWYHRLGGSRITHVGNYSGLLKKIKTVFVKKVPLVNVLIRSHNRPNFFRDCMASIEGQSHPNIRVLVSYDNQQTRKYLVPYKVNPIEVHPASDNVLPKPKSGDYGVYFPMNAYWNALNKSVRDGWVMNLDDDDWFLSPDALSTILSNVQSEDDLLLWRVGFQDRIIPSDENFGKKIQVRDISGIGYMCHSKHLKDVVIEPYRRADYRLIKHLSEKLNVRWIDKVLTGPQEGVCGMGTKEDKT